MEIVFSAEIGDITATQLNLSDGRLEETLILHTALGKDHFLTVAGQYGTCLCAYRLRHSVLHSEFTRTHLLCDKPRSLGAAAWPCEAACKSAIIVRR